jgi:hypothetical protein
MRPPSKSLPPSYPASGQLLRTGCLGAALGLLLAVGLLVFTILWTGYIGFLPPPVADPSEPDITIAVQEAYLNQVAAQSLPALPSGLATQVQIDLQPGNRLAFKSRLQSTLLGQNIGGDVSGTAVLEARDGELAISFRDISLFGFSLPAIGQTLVNELSARLSQLINDQVEAGLGQSTYIMSLTTDDRQMVIRARLP